MICLCMAGLPCLFSMPHFVMADIHQLADVGISSILVCRENWPNATLRKGYKLTTCFVQFFVPVLVVVSKKITTTFWPL